MYSLMHHFMSAFKNPVPNQFRPEIISPELHRMPTKGFICLWFNVDNLETNFSQSDLKEQNTINDKSHPARI